MHAHDEQCTPTTFMANTWWVDLRVPVQFGRLIEGIYMLHVQLLYSDAFFFFFSLLLVQYGLKICICPTDFECEACQEWYIDPMKTNAVVIKFVLLYLNNSLCRTEVGSSIGKQTKTTISANIYQIIWWSNCNVVFQIIDV